jgi:hypothetical protein
MCGAVPALSIATAKRNWHVCQFQGVYPQPVKPARASESGDDLGPNGYYADEKRQRGKNSGFFDDGAKH